jgi:hypothetical protein
MLFLNIQVLHSVIFTLDYTVMREEVHIVLTTILLLLLGLLIILGYEAFATIEIPNMTKTEPLQQQQPLPPPSNISQQVQQQQQQPVNTTALQLQQPTIGQTPVSQLQQLTATPTSPQYGPQQPIAQVPLTT